MNHVVKKLIAAAAAGAVLSGGAVFAAEAPQLEIRVPQADSQADSAPVVNGAAALSVVVRDVNGITMMPLRQVVEALGYTVTWNGEAESIELIKGAQYITMSLNQDAYAFSRMAPQPLGAAPTLVDDITPGDATTTYVPLAFVTEILGGYYRENPDGTLDIVNPSVVTVSSVNEDGSFLVEDIAHGQVLVRIGENTEIVRNGAPAAAADIAEGMVLDVEYGPAMTMSIPPQTTAVRIELPALDTPEVEPDQGFAFRGVITDITDNLVTIGDPQDPDALQLAVSQDTQITRMPDRRIYGLDDLKVGMEISGAHAEPMTMSIPPMTAALTINIESGIE